MLTLIILVQMVLIFTNFALIVIKILSTVRNDWLGILHTFSIIQIITFIAILTFFIVFKYWTIESFYHSTLLILKLKISIKFLLNHRSQSFSCERTHKSTLVILDIFNGAGGTLVTKDVGVHQTVVFLIDLSALFQI